MLDVQTKIGTVTLNVADLSAMTDFYRDVIGLQVLAQSKEMVRLGTSKRSLVELRPLRNGRFIPQTTGLYHFALRVPTRQALANWLQHYAKQNAPFWQGASDHGVSEALYLSDPEGNGIEVYWDRSKTLWPLAQDGTLSMYTRHLDLQALLNRAETNKWSGIAPETDMGHIHLEVADIAVAKRFYVTTLGFNLIIEMPGSALFVAAGDYHHHIGLNTWHSLQAPPAPADAYGLAQFEILFVQQSAIQNTIARLKQANHPFEINTDGLSLDDPFNITIVLRTV